MILLTCEIGQGAMPHLKALRLAHLRYIAAHQALIRFGGPARAPDGTPETMVIALATDERSIAETFIANEPYAASGAVFASITIRAWSQVIPELRPGALADDIAAEAARTGAT